MMPRSSVVDLGIMSEITVDRARRSVHTIRRRTCAVPRKVRRQTTEQNLDAGIAHQLFASVPEWWLRLVRERSIRANIAARVRNSDRKTWQHDALRAIEDQWLDWPTAASDGRRVPSESRQAFLGLVEDIEVARLLGSSILGQIERERLQCERLVSLEELADRLQAAVDDVRRRFQVQASKLVGYGLVPFLGAFVNQVRGAMEYTCYESHFLSVSWLYKQRAWPSALCIRYPKSLKLAAAAPELITIANVLNDFPAEFIQGGIRGRVEVSRELFRVFAGCVERIVQIVQDDAKPKSKPDRPSAEEARSFLSHCNPERVKRAEALCLQAPSGSRLKVVYADMKGAQAEKVRIVRALVLTDGRIAEKFPEILRKRFDLD